MTKRELGENLFKQGYNCAQAVAIAFAEEVKLDKDFIAKSISGFGGGFGRMREVCGAVSGMVFILSALEGSVDPTDNNAKMEIYQKVQELMKEFKEQNGTYICRELLALPEEHRPPTPEERTEIYYKKRPCADMCRIAAEIANKYVK